MVDTVQCYICTEGEFDPYGEMDGETVQVKCSAPTHQRVQDQF
jgi:hypothetical protein